ncbi:Rubrerythrin [mine drainage metagenome]|uniref:Rubrerythrin n=1 Tax=mine drainage metagenome TaxID=410659 RepID=T1BHQ7_9ZZZZ
MKVDRPSSLTWHRRGGEIDVKDLTEQQILALAISLEEDDARIYEQYADTLRENYPASAQMFTVVAQEEHQHRHRLIDLYQSKFGDRIPLIRRQDVRGFIERKPIWLIQPLDIGKIRRQVEMMESESEAFYAKAAQRSQDAAIRKLLGDLAAEESVHEAKAESIESELITDAVHVSEKETHRRQMLLQIIQPGLAGLMDGSVSTLAPIFAAAFATHNTSSTFLIGLAAAIGAGISMAFAEAMSDTGLLTGRGSPWVRGFVTGGMTALGGLFHTLPFLISNFRLAVSVAVAVVLVELITIAWIRRRYMDTPFLAAVFQVVVGGALVFLAGILIGSA